MKGWVQQRSSLEKSLLLVSVALIFALVILIAITVTLQGNGGLNSDSNGITCTTKECIKTAGQMLSKLSEKSNPCTDFYKFACGGYGNAAVGSVALNSVHSLYSSIRNIIESSSSANEVELDPIRSLYRSCMEFEGLQEEGKKPDEALKSLMAEVGVGTWPVIDAYFDVDSNLSQDERLVGLLLIGIPIAYKVTIVPDPRVNGSFIMKLSPGSPHAARSLESDVRGDAKLKTHMLSSFLLLGAPYTRAAADVLDILSVDNAYAEIEQNTNTECESTDTLSPDETLAELSRLIKNNDWSVLLTAVQKAAGLTRPFAVQVYCKEKIQKYLDYLNDLSVRSAYNYLGWRFFTAFESHIIPSLRRLQNVEYSRWEECIKLLERFAAPTLSHALTLHDVHNETIENVLKMTSNTRASVENILSSTKWLNKDQKSKIKQELKSIDIQLPFTQKSVENEPLLLKNLEVSNNNYTSTIIELYRRSVARMLKKLNSFTQINMDAQKLHLTETFISVEDSYTSIPFDKIQEPYFSTDVPEWKNFGGLGIFTARELSKTLLVQNLGISLEDETTLWDVWYSNRDASGCLLNYISSRFGLKDGNEMAMRKWIRELFLDSSSLEIAYQSSGIGSTSKMRQLPGLSKTKEQLFFIAFAQTQCASKNGEANSAYIPIRDRVNAAVFNSRAFIKAFSCDSSSTCDTW